MMAEELFIVNLYGTEKEIDLLDSLLDRDAGNSHLAEVNTLIQAVRLRIGGHHASLKQAA